MMTSKLYISILVEVTLTLSQVHRGARKQNIMNQLFYKVSNGFGWTAVRFVGLIATHSFLYRLIHIQGREPNFGD